MTPFTQMTGIAAALPVANVDTDMIVPAAFLKTVSRRGLGGGLFHTARYDDAGRERPEFVLNRAPWRDASILVALDNFGCGSSREHAPWALLDFGIRCVIAPSFADIFYNNCFKNGMLPITLDRARLDQLMTTIQHPESAVLSIDLETNSIAYGDLAAPPIAFTLDEQRRQRLLHGIDDITNTLRHVALISSHEKRVRAATPWLSHTGLDAWDG